MWWWQPFKFIRYIAVVRKDNSFYLQKRKGMYFFYETPPKAYSALTINGNIETTNNTIIKLKSAINPWVFVLLSIPLLFMIFLLLVPAIIKWYFFHKPFIVPDVAMPFLLFAMIFTFSIVTIQYKIQYFFTKRFLKKLLEAEIVK